MDYVILQWRFAELMHQCRQCVLGQVWKLYVWISLLLTTTAVTWRTKQKQKQQQN